MLNKAFGTKEKSFKVKTISKSLAENFENCKRRAWRKVRNNRDQESEALQVGLYAHELFASEAAKRMGVTYTPNKKVSPKIAYKAKEAMVGVNFDILVGEGNILAFEHKVSEVLDSGIELLGYIDLLVLKNSPNGEPYIEVIDFKISPVISEEVDNEVIFYTYLVALESGLDVVFTRFSGRTGKRFSKYFTNKEALSFKPFIESYVLNIVEVLESEEEPFPEVSSKCITCPYLDECSAKHYSETDPVQLLTKQKLLEIELKKVKAALNSLIVEKGVIETPKMVMKREAVDNIKLIPKKGKVNKKVIFNQIVQRGLLKNYLDYLSLDSYSKDLMDQLKQDMPDLVDYEVIKKFKISTEEKDQNEK